MTETGVTVVTEKFLPAVRNTLRRSCPVQLSNLTIDHGADCDQTDKKTYMIHFEGLFILRDFSVRKRFICSVELVIDGRRKTVTLLLIR